MALPPPCAALTHPPPQGVYTAGVVLMFPAMVMAMAAGAVFGMLAGTALVWVGSSVGQTIAFVIGRRVLRAAKLGWLCLGKAGLGACGAELGMRAGLGTAAPPAASSWRRGCLHSWLSRLRSRARCPVWYRRYLLRELVVQYLSRQFPKWTAIDRALETEGWKLVTLLRLSPIVSCVPAAAAPAAGS